MIITKLQGGLGNQMFQYACGRSLSIELGENLKVDISSYDGNNSRDTKRYFSLDHYNAVIDVASPEDINDAEKALAPSLATKIIKKSLSLVGAPMPEPTFGSIRQNKTKYLSGFWQSENYFKSHSDSIRKDLTLKEPLGEKTKFILNDIINRDNTVALHVRRGDYIKDKATREYHGICEPGYYRKAISYIVDKIGSPNIFIFSDDIGWATKNIQFPFSTTYVSKPEIKDYEEMHLMSNCQNHVIANSSFSWWAAWLNERKDKIVIAPEKWFARHPSTYKNIVPSSWIKM